MKDYRDREAIKGLIDDGAIFFCGHSGGKDSQAMYILLKELVPHDRLFVVHADLGDIEWNGVKEHIRANIDHELIIAKAKHKDGRDADFFSLVRRQADAHKAKGRDIAPWPDNKNRFCTSDLKTGPIWREIRRVAKEVDASIVVNCVGIRAGESPARAKKIKNNGTLRVNKKSSNKSRVAYDWWPIADWTCRTDKEFIPGRPEVFDVIKEAGEVPHWAYSAGNDRLSCMFCIFGSTNDIRHAAKENPALFEKYVALERETGYTMFNGKSINDRIIVRG